MVCFLTITDNQLIVFLKSHFFFPPFSHTHTLSLKKKARADMSDYGSPSDSPRGNRPVDDAEKHLNSKQLTTDEVLLETMHAVQALNTMTRAIQQQNVRGAAAQRLGEGKVYHRVLTMEWSASPDELENLPSRAEWTAQNPKCAFPADMSKEEADKKFPGGKALLIGVKVYSPENTFRFGVGVNFPGISGIVEKSYSNGAGQNSYHLTVAAGKKDTDVINLPSANGEESLSLLQKYPGFTPQNIRKRGVLQEGESTDSGVTYLSPTHPAISAAISVLSASQDENDLNALSALDSALNSGEPWISMPSDMAEGAFSATEKEYSDKLKIIDLNKIAHATIHRPGMKFNEPSNIRLTESDLIANMIKSLTDAPTATSMKEAVSGSSITPGGTMLNAARSAGSSSATHADGDSKSKAQMLADVMKAAAHLNMQVELSYMSLVDGM